MREASTILKRDRQSPNSREVFGENAEECTRDS
jgi:hypothetical protein